MTDWEDMPRTVFHVLVSTYNDRVQLPERQSHERLDLHIEKLRQLARKHGLGTAVIRVTTELIEHAVEE